MPHHVSIAGVRGLAAVWVFVLAAGLLSPSAQAWSWKLNNAVYQELDVFARDQYQKAETAFEKKNYKLAANEFKRFTLEFGATPAVSAAAFMHAHAVMYDEKRYEAIKLYQEVVDFFPDDTNYAPAAMYYIGAAYIANGDVRQGLKELEELVESTRYKGHPLVANALESLADNYRKNDDWVKYFKYGTRIHSEYFGSNRRESEEMRRELTEWYLKTSRYKEIEELNAIHAYKDGKANAGYWYYIWDCAYGSTLANARNAFYTPKEEPERKEAIEKFWTYWLSGQEVITKHSRWEWQRRSLEYLLRYRRGAKEEWSKLLDETVANNKDDAQVRHVIKLLMSYGMLERARELFPLVKDQQGLYVWYSLELINSNQFEEAAHVIGKIVDPGVQKWRTYELYARQNDWKHCVETLKEIKDNDPDRAVRATWALADIYRERTRQYEDAVKLYQSIAEPPNTSFRIADAFKRWGRQRQAHETYTEIENFFPAHAAKAASYRGHMWLDFGDKEQAIAEFRRILKIYKGTPEASDAHVQLEKLGVATGGGKI